MFEENKNTLAQVVRKPKKKLVILIASVVFVLLIASVGAYYWFVLRSDRGDNQEETSLVKTYQTLSSEIENLQVDSDEDKASIISQEYSDDYMKVQNSSVQPQVAEWNQERVAEIYFLISYAWGVKDSRMAIGYLDQLEEARAAGVHIDQPGRDEAYRRSLRAEIESDTSTPRTYSQKDLP